MLILRDKMMSKKGEGSEWYHTRLCCFHWNSNFSSFVDFPGEEPGATASQ